MHAYSRTQTPNISIKFSLTKEHNKENLPSLFVDHCAFFFFFFFLREGWMCIWQAQNEKIIIKLFGFLEHIMVGHITDQQSASKHDKHLYLN